MHGLTALNMTHQTEKCLKTIWRENVGLNGNNDILLSYQNISVGAKSWDIPQM